jgi:hypothetical protein
MILLISIVVYLLITVPISIFRPRLFFDPQSKMPYTFGISDAKSRPYSLSTLFQTLALIIYFCTTFFMFKIYSIQKLDHVNTYNTYAT